jgi:hypothetical protein
MKSTRPTSTCWLLLAACVSLTGCVAKTYKYGIAHDDLIATLPRTPNLITVGGHHPRIDSIENTVQYPAKKFRQWFPPKEPLKDPETLRLETVRSATDYLDENGLQGVYVDVREYNPSEQWSRLRNNQRINPFWKYTGGTLYHVGYCLLPGRALHADYYNGFTNTLSINSTSPSTSLLQSGYVKKLYDQRYPGTYMASNWLPILPLFRDSAVASDVLTYTRMKNNWPLEKELVPQVYAQLGGNTVSQATSLIPGVAYLPIYFQPLLTMAGSAAGETTGQVIVKRREKQMASSIRR